MTSMGKLKLKSMFEFDTFNKAKSLKDLNPLAYTCIPKYDTIAVELIEPDMHRGPWIAGGAALQWYQDKEVGLHDIDVFCRTPQQAQQLIDKLLRKYSDNTQLLFKSENAYTISVIPDRYVAKSWKIQIITKEYFDNVEQVLNRFDITVCKIATDGFTWHLGPQMAADLRTRTLRMVYVKPDSIKRYSKYMAYGFMPTDGLFEQVVTAADWDLEVDLGDYNAF